MAETITKTCPICYSTVDARAKKCPHCHSLLGFYKVLIPAMVCAGILGFFGFIAILIWAASPGPRPVPSDLAGNIKVVSSKHYFAPSSNNGTTTVIIGSLSNTGDQTINSPEIEARFYNKENELIDLFTDSYFGRIAPHKETPFKITEIANIHLPEADYATHKLIIKHAYADE
jgi:hypothetical protein